MKGTDVTQAQMEHADAFLRAVRKDIGTGQVWLRRDDLVRLLAWYAAIRVKKGSELGKIKELGDRA